MVYLFDPVGVLLWDAKFARHQCTLTLHVDVISRVKPDQILLWKMLCHHDQFVLWVCRTFPRILTVKVAASVQVILVT